MEAAFKPGDTVRIRVGSPPGHCRTPAYIQGKIGRIERVHGAFRNPWHTAAMAYRNNSSTLCR